MSAVCRVCRRLGGALYLGLGFLEGGDEGGLDGAALLEPLHHRRGRLLPQKVVPAPLQEVLPALGDHLILFFLHVLKKN